MKQTFTLNETACVACGCCAKACPQNAITIHQGICAKIDKTRCVACGLCAKVCPASIIKGVPL